MIEGEQKLIAKAQKGEADAFAHLYKHYHPRIYRFVAAKVSFRHEAEDLTHEVFMSAWKNVVSFKPKGFPFSSWLYRIARNRVIDHYRTSKRSEDIENVPEGVVAVMDDLEGLLDNKIEFERVRSQFENLSLDQQDVLFLRFVEEREVKEIAEILEKSEANIRIIQHRAINKLKELLS